MAEIAQTCNAPRQTILSAGSRHEMLQCIDGACWGITLHGGKGRHLRPETHRVAQLTFGDLP